MHMRIAVCDDEKIIFSELNTLFNEYSKMTAEIISATHFSSGRDLLASSIQFDLIFMDYQMDGLDGMETSRALRRSGSRSWITALLRCWKRLATCA